MSLADKLMEMAGQYKQQHQQRANTQRGVANYLLSQGGPFTGLAGMLVNYRADKIDHQNAQLAKKEATAAAQQAQARQWEHEEQAAQQAHNRELAKLLMQRNWNQEDRQAQWEHDENVAQKTHDRELAKLLMQRNWNQEDRQAQWGHEADVAKRNRDWQQEDQRDKYSHDKDMANMNHQLNLGQMKTKAMIDRASKEMTFGDMQSYLEDPGQEIVKTGLFGGGVGLKQTQPQEVPGQQTTWVQQPQQAQQSFVPQVPSIADLFNPLAKKPWQK